MSMLLRSKRQRMAPTVPAMVPLSKQRETVKKTLTKKPKEKREKKRKMVRERKKRKAMTKYFYFCCHPTSSFRTTYTKYATSSSSLLSKKGARRDRLRQFEKKPNPTREMPDQSLSKNDRTSVIKRKNPKRWCFLSNK